jgi:hypothetical protein
MRFSILHISDLHRDLNDEINNNWLLDSLENDFQQFKNQEPQIEVPALCIVSGDLVYGVSAASVNPVAELKRQYMQAEEFLAGMSDRFFDGKRERVVILPGNHDIAYNDVMASTRRIDIPSEPDKKSRIVADLFKPNSRFRWSWRELCFYEINDEERYRKSLQEFAAMYERFYQSKRKYELVPERQYDLFDFPDLGFCVAALNSCFRNDPLRRTGAFHPTALTDACRSLRHTSRVGWLRAAAWHHNIAGGPSSDDYLDNQFLQLLIDAGVSLGFHGHQHLAECFDERYRIGLNPRKMTVVSASTLCADPRNLKPGVPRSYNVIALDTAAWTGRVHQRQMVNMLFPLPIWGPGHFNSTNSSYVDFALCKPLEDRPAQLDIRLTLERAERLLGEHQWHEVLNVLSSFTEIELARPLILKGLTALGDSRRIITMLWPPLTISEIVTMGGAILESGTKEEGKAFVELARVANSPDASVREISRRIQERRLR